MNLGKTEAEQFLKFVLDFEYLPVGFKVYVYIFYNPKPRKTINSYENILHNKRKKLYTQTTF